jgi:hypothetical protein
MEQPQLLLVAKGNANPMMALLHQNNDMWLRREVELLQA